MSFYCDTHVKAVRKQHRCDGCMRYIEVGQPATRWAGMTDGQFGTAIYHPDCREAECAMNWDVLGYMSGDDWWALIDIESDDWEWLADAFPAVAERMGIVAKLVKRAPKDGTTGRQLGPGRDQETALNHQEGEP